VKALSDLGFGSNDLRYVKKEFSDV
jgi:hypothetical protein